MRYALRALIYRLQRLLRLRRWAPHRHWRPLEAVIRETRAPPSMQWNVNVQGELPGNLMLESAYVGTRGLQLHSGVALNQLTPDRMALGSQLNQLVDNPFFGKISSGASSPYHSWQNSRLDSYFDRSVFSQPAPFTFGNLGTRGPDIRSDGIRNFDLSISASSNASTCSSAANSSTPSIRPASAAPIPA